MYTPKKTAIERSQQTVRAAQVFRQHAGQIAHACEHASAGEIILAGVTREVMWGGTMTIPAGDLSSTAPEDKYGWTLVFSPLLSVAQIEERCLRLARCSFKRWEALRTMAVTRGLSTDLDPEMP